MSEIFTCDARASDWGPGRFGWSLRRVEGMVVIRLVGELDLWTAGELRRLLMRVAEASTPPTIVLDLSHVRFIDAHSIGLILTARAAGRRRGRQLWVEGLHGAAALMFNTLGLEPVLVRPTRHDEVGKGPGGRIEGARGDAAVRRSGEGADEAGRPVASRRR